MFAVGLGSVEFTEGIELCSGTVTDKVKDMVWLMPAVKGVALAIKIISAQIMEQAL